MLAPDDLDAAVAHGIITDAQARALRDLAETREKARAAALGHEERFRFMRGFNDFFFASGVLLFGVGAVYFAGTIMLGNLVAAAVIWALAELLVGRMRLVLPGLLLVIFFVYFTSLAVPIGIWVSSFARPTFAPMGPLLDGFTGYGNAAVTTARGFIIAIAGLAFFARFSFPFALLPVAGGIVLAAMTTARSLLPASAAEVILLLCGLAVFAAAMAFDVSDRERVTRRSDCAFWLHLLAAPLIVHSLIWIATANSLTTMSNHAAAIIVAIVLVLTLIAVVIDRRALLVSTLTYLGIVIAYALKAASVDQSKIFFATLLVLGAMVLTLGVGWLPLRRILMCLLPARLATHLPPVVPAA